MTRKFTQEELEDAWKQMKEERKADYTKAALACKHLRAALNLGKYCVSLLSGYENCHVSPKPHLYTLCIGFRTGKEESAFFDSETEIPLLENLVTKLTTTSGIRQLPNESFGRLIFEVDTPSGKYDVRLEHIDK